MRAHKLLIISFFIYFSLIVCNTGNAFANPEINRANIKVEIMGLPKSLESSVLSNLSIKAAEQENKLNPDRIESLHQLAPQEITATLEALGYYQSRVIAEINHHENKYQVKYRIALGVATLINSVKVQVKGEGQNHPKIQAWVNHPPLIKGQIVKQSEYENYKQTLLSQALQFGFLDVCFEKNEIRIDARKNQANIILILDTGKQYRMGEVTFKEPPYPTAYLEKYISFNSGAPYTTENIAAFQKNLTETDLFRYVRIDSSIDESCNYVVPLNVRLKPRPRNRYFGSLGFGTDTGMRGMLGFERRRQSYPGHRINTSVRGSKYFNEINMRYTIPGYHPATDRLVFGLKVTDEKQRDKKYSKRGNLSATQIKKFGEVERILDLNFLSETYLTLPGNPKQSSHFLMPSIGAVWTHVTETEPNQIGFRLSTTLRGGVGMFASSTSFIQGDCRFKWVAPLGDSARFIFRTQVGATATRNFNEIPLSLRYFAGGDHTVRGYGYKSLGPYRRDPYGNYVNVGGRYLFVNSMEIEKTVYKDFALATFVDSGNAMNSWKVKMATSAGLGLRYKTPIGTLRLDVAQPLQEHHQKPRVHITFGMDL